MILMLDTDYCVDLIRNKALRNRIIPWLSKHEAGELGISVITVQKS